MKKIKFKEKAGNTINLIAFDGETDTALLDRSVTDSPTPYVVVKGLDMQEGTWNYAEGYFDNFEKSVSKFRETVASDSKIIPHLKDVYEYLLRTDVEPSLCREFTPDEIEQSYDRLMNGLDVNTLLNQVIIDDVDKMLDENQMRENLKIQNVLDVLLEDDDRSKGGISFTGETVADFVFSSGLDQDESLDVLNNSLSQCGIRILEKDQYPFTNLEHMIVDKEYRTKIINVKDYIEEHLCDYFEGDLDEFTNAVFDAVCNDYKLSRLVNNCRNDDELKTFFASESVTPLYDKALDQYIKEYMTNEMEL